MTLAEIINFKTNNFIKIDNYLLVSPTNHVIDVIGNYFENYDYCRGLFVLLVGNYRDDDYVDNFVNLMIKNKEFYLAI